MRATTPFPHLFPGTHILLETHWSFIGHLLYKWPGESRWEFTKSHSENFWNLRISSWTIFKYDVFLWVSWIKIVFCENRFIPLPYSLCRGKVWMKLRDGFFTVMLGFLNRTPQVWHVGGDGGRQKLLLILLFRIPAGNSSLYLKEPPTLGRCPLPISTPSASIDIASSSFP